MSDVRCRACGAAVPGEAQWCSLCFADLREPTPVRERVSVPAAPSEAEADAVVPVAATATVAAATNGARPDPDAMLGLPATAPEEAVEAVDGATTETQPAEEAKWPCLRCGAEVPISYDACHACGAGFLAGSIKPLNAKLPIVGDIARFSRNQRIGFGFVACIVFIVVLVVLATIGGSLL